MLSASFARGERRKNAGNSRRARFAAYVVFWYFGIFVVVVESLKRHGKSFVIHRLEIPTDVPYRGVLSTSLLVLWWKPIYFSSFFFLFLWGTDICIFLSPYRGAGLTGLTLNAHRPLPVVVGSSFS